MKPRGRREGNDTMSDENEMRSIDRVRAGQMIVAAMTNDVVMFAAAVQDTFDDDYGIGGMGSTINVLRGLAEDLGAAIIDRQGQEQGVALMQQILAQELSS